MQNKVLTTGEIAKHCGVNFRTVIRWIERGYLEAYRLPGRGDNRIRLPDFITFLQQYGMPIPEEFQSVRRRVLIVEDERPIRVLIERVLSDAGFETRVARDGFEAGVILGTYQPAVVTLDLSMPGVDGHRVIEQVRETPQLKNCRILVVSGLPKEDLDAAVEAGADLALAKPFENRVLLSKVTELAGIDIDSGVYQAV